MSISSHPSPRPDIPHDCDSGVRYGSPDNGVGDCYPLEFDDDEKTDPCNMVAIVRSQESSVSGLSLVAQGISDEIGRVVTPDCLLQDSDDE